MIGAYIYLLNSNRVLINDVYKKFGKILEKSTMGILFIPLYIVGGHFMKTVKNLDLDSIESRICHHLSFLLNVITAWHIKPNTREKQPPPNSDAPHPAPDIVIKPPTKKIPMPRNIPTP